MSGDTKSSIDIARQALKQLALNQIAPTPDNFKKVYEQISGQVSSKTNEVHLFQVFEKVLREAGETRFEYAQLARDMKYALAHDDWEKVEFQLKRLLRDMTASHADDEVVAKLHDPALLWRDLLVQLLELGLITQIQHIPELEKKAKLLLDKAKSAESIEDIRKLKKSFESYWLKLQQNASASHVLHQELMQLFQLLIENMSHLALDDDWMHGQIDIVKNLIGQPLNIDMVNEVKTNLSALLFRQKLLKNSLLDAKEALKKMAVNCLELLKNVSGDAGEHHEKIVSYQTQINQTKDVRTLNAILENLKQDMASMESSALNSYQTLQDAHAKIKSADELVEKLAMQLDMVNQAALQDHLTGALNKRGMEDAILREFARADAKEQPLCLALLDIDDFKMLNEKLGHVSGDEAIKHLAEVVHQNLRNEDVLVRYSGETFMIILPNTPLQDAEALLQKVQRELTKHLFLFENSKHLITFSAGVTLRSIMEVFDPVMLRAENALYEAKHTGRNKVVQMAA